MRSSLLLVLASAPLVACTSDSAAPPEQPAFEIQSSDITLNPGDEITKCFYFHTPNTDDAVVNKWVSDMTPGSHHMIVFTSLTASMQPADGTIDDCSGGGGVLGFPPHRKFYRRVI